MEGCKCIVLFFLLGRENFMSLMCFTVAGLLFSGSKGYFSYTFCVGRLGVASEAGPRLRLTNGLREQRTHMAALLATRRILA